MSIKLQVPKPVDLKPRITVIGVGGAGGNAINNMIASGLDGVEYIVANTDAQALAASSAERRIQLGVNLTEGLGAGSKPEIGEAAAEEALAEIQSHLAGSHMVFIAAGMGGGTGTGAAGVIARAARELGILTVGIVTKPFHFEGTRRMRTAEAGIAELQKYVDTLIVIPNQNLFRVATEKTTFAEAFELADQVLYAGVACIVDLIVKEGLINLDFADVRTVMCGMGSAMMGTGEASGERRATLAAEEAISNPLLDDVTLKGARGLLLSIIGGRDMTLYEVDEAASRVRQEVDAEANIIVGATFDESMGDRIRVAIVASGMAPTTLQEHRSSSNARHFGASPSHGDRSSGEPYRRPEPPFVAPRQGRPPVPHEMQQRLSEELGHDGMRPQDATPDNTRHATEIRHASEEPRRPAGREAWRAPGGVVIEEGLPPFNSTGMPSRTAPPPLDPAAHNGFTPGPPQPLKRERRRTPDVADLPQVAQREYHAKSAQYAEQSDDVPRAYASSAPRQAPRKKSLLQRLVAAGRQGGSD
ncbi:MAG TPA: cell division protein FtsZ [Hyphomicrobiaceae bacterium]|nr:cell division protein FtsZ [Hyphomicrobiaceae bacterium]